MSTRPPSTSYWFGTDLVGRDVLTRIAFAYRISLSLSLVVLAIAQMGVHLVFFLHIGTGPDSTNNVLAVAFGVLIVFLVVAGSLWIMADLNAGMMLPELMDMHMQH